MSFSMPPSATRPCARLFRNARIPTFAVGILAFLNATPAWRKDDDDAEAGMENDMSAML